MTPNDFDLVWPIVLILMTAAVIALIVWFVRKRKTVETRSEGTQSQIHNGARGESIGHADADTEKLNP